ncbi:MAG TPA: TIGR03066 family protein [Fimbriiglobus sp.]|nr:TIGR03066 family protein [Fimbriiglobus sp.]
MRPTAACLLGTALLALPALSAPIPRADKKTNAEKIVGKWEMTKSGADTPKDTKFVVEFAKDGAMTLRVEPKDGDKFTLKGKYKVDGEKINYEMEEPDGGKKKETLTIKKLTDEELVTVDPDDIKEEFKRVKEKKDKEEK